MLTSAVAASRLTLRNSFPTLGLRPRLPADVASRLCEKRNFKKRERGTLALQVLFALLLTMQRLTADQEPGWQLLDGVPRWRFLKLRCFLPPLPRNIDVKQASMEEKLERQCFGGEGWGEGASLASGFPLTLTLLWAPVCQGVNVKIFGFCFRRLRLRYSGVVG